MKEVVLNEVCKIRNGFAFKSDQFKDRGTPLLRISNFDDGEVYLDEKTVFVDESFLKSKSEFKVEKGDVLIALSGATTGKYGVYNFDYPSLLNQRIGLLKSGLSKELSSSYFFYYLNILKREILRKAGGAAQPNISTRAIGELKIPLPPLPQQQHIAKVLDTAEAYRQKTKALIEKYDALKQSLFLEMFGDPVTNPKKFIKSTVGKQCIVKGGKRVPKGEKLVRENTGYPYIKAGNIKNGKITTKNIEYLTPEIRNKLKRYIVEKGNVCITVVGINIGDIGIVPDELHLANLTENANKLLINDESILSNFYLCFALQSNYVQQQINKRTMAVGVPKLALYRIQQLEILIPPVELQNQFAERIQAIEAQKTIAQEQLKQAENLFNSLLQKAFKGELKL